MNIDEPISIVEYNQEWPFYFDQEKQSISRVFKNTSPNIEHIGSTAVPFLASKPIIDILIGVDAASFQEPQNIISALDSLKYEYCGEAGVIGRLYFRKRADVSFNVHVVVFQSERWVNNVLVRDYLRAHPKAAKSYGEYKKQLINEGANTLIAYSEKKHAFMGHLIEQAKKLPHN